MSVLRGRLDQICPNVSVHGASIVGVAASGICVLISAVRPCRGSCPSVRFYHHWVRSVPHTTQHYLWRTICSVQRLRTAQIYSVLWLLRAEWSYDGCMNYDGCTLPNPVHTAPIELTLRLPPSPLQRCYANIPMLKSYLLPTKEWVPEHAWLSTMNGCPRRHKNPRRSKPRAD